jgi:hypothetical protein
VRARESLRASADQHHMIGAFEHQPGDAARRLDALECAHRAALPELAGMNRGIELHHTVLIWKPTVADGRVLGIEFDHHRALDHGIEGSPARPQDFPGRRMHLAAPLFAATT